jgi:hypothetical protein
MILRIQNKTGAEPMVFKEKIEINAILNVVWKNFPQMEDWDSWNTA